MLYDTYQNLELASPACLPYRRKPWSAANPQILQKKLFIEELTPVASCALLLYCCPVCFCLV
eukprot:scaffold139977_cov18-Tisochrysis_lutea.AAC.2